MYVCESIWSFENGYTSRVSSGFGAIRSTRNGERLASAIQDRSRQFSKRDPDCDAATTPKRVKLEDEVTATTSSETASAVAAAPPLSESDDNNEDGVAVISHGSVASLSRLRDATYKFTIATGPWRTRLGVASLKAKSSVRGNEDRSDPPGVPCVLVLKLAALVALPNTLVRWKAVETAIVLKYDHAFFVRQDGRICCLIAGMYQVHLNLCHLSEGHYAHKLQLDDQCIQERSGRFTATANLLCGRRSGEPRILGALYRWRMLEARLDHVTDLARTSILLENKGIRGSEAEHPL
ncbi:hypothetical protein FI667_g234, partial [Globisporangium splendens]